MHGVILAALKKFAEATFGGNAWGAWLQQAQLASLDRSALSAGIPAGGPRRGVLGTGV
jgi:hypothetical protein